MERALDKIQHSLMTNTINELGIKGNFLNIRKSPVAGMSHGLQYPQGWNA